MKLTRDCVPYFSELFNDISYPGTINPGLAVSKIAEFFRADSCLAYGNLENGTCSVDFLDVSREITVDEVREIVKEDFEGVVSVFVFPLMFCDSYRLVWKGNSPEYSGDVTICWGHNGNPKVDKTNKDLLIDTLEPGTVKAVFTGLEVEERREVENVIDSAAFINDANNLDDTNMIFARRGYHPFSTSPIVRVENVGYFMVGCFDACFRQFEVSDDCSFMVFPYDGGADVKVGLFGEKADFDEEFIEKVDNEFELLLRDKDFAYSVADKVKNPPLVPLMLGITPPRIEEEKNGVFLFKVVEPWSGGDDNFRYMAVPGKVMKDETILEYGNRFGRIQKLDTTNFTVTDTDEPIVKHKQIEDTIMLHKYSLVVSKVFYSGKPVEEMVKEVKKLSETKKLPEKVLLFSNPTDKEVRALEKFGEATKI